MKKNVSKVFFIAFLLILNLSSLSAQSFPQGSTSGTTQMNSNVP